MNAAIEVGMQVEFRAWHPDGPWVIGHVIDVFGRYSLVQTARYGVPMLIRTDNLQPLQPLTGAKS